jgi:hypothetical protein
MSVINSVAYKKWSVMNIDGYVSHSTDGFAFSSLLIQRNTIITPVACRKVSAKLHYNFFRCNLSYSILRPEQSSVVANVRWIHLLIACRKLCEVHECNLSGYLTPKHFQLFPYYP